MIPGAPVLTRWAVPCLALVCFGCPTQAPDDGNVNVDPGSQPNLRTAGEPNDTFDQPVDVVFDANDSAQLAGQISTRDDLDIYSLGALNAGDRLVIDVGTTGRLDSAIALFDALGELTFENDDRNLSLNQLDPFLNAVLRHSSPTYYLAIAAAPLADFNQMLGNYEITIHLARGGEVPATAGQIVVLDFGGGTIAIPGDDVYTVGPFNAGDIDPAYAGQTPAVRQRIRAVVEENFLGLALDVRSFPESPFPPAGTYSRVLFGGTNPSAFGISQAIDPYNSDQTDGSIVFTEMFTPNRFGRVLTAQELGTAIGNVAAHELGHILGLNHVANSFDLMDTEGGADTLLLDQEFITSPLDDSIFPIGLQDSFMLLLETLGAR